jgi:hypothetical protein
VSSPLFRQEVLDAQVAQYLASIRIGPNSRHARVAPRPRGVRWRQPFSAAPKLWTCGRCASRTDRRLGQRYEVLTAPSFHHGPPALHQQVVPPSSPPN